MHHPLPSSRPPGSVAWLALAACLGVMASAGTGAADSRPGAASDSSRTEPCTRLIAPGATLRLRAPDADHGGLMRTATVERGLLVRATPDSLWLAPDLAHPATPFALADVQRIEVLSGRSHVGGVLAGAGAGFLCGFAAALLVATVVADRQNLDQSDAGMAAVVFTIGGVAIGTTAGAAIGGVRGLDRWEEVR